ncbi:MAG: hypothetical protein IMY73_03620 [Bacteroidetes bacterium]|nr:hypothetical protein [Bacteroidota bacterium]
MRGKWGKGKTSYLNMMQKVVSEKYNDEVIILRFNPWRNSNYNQLTRNFLKVIGEGIGDISIKNTINNYLKTIVDTDINWVSKSVSSIIGGKNKYADELFEDVSEKIQKLDKLLIIQVDDIDRLTGEEIFNTLKLIRNIADFKNTVFIVAYDHDYVISSLKELQIKEEYLEKIFNIFYYLPAVRKDRLIDIISDFLKNFLSFKGEQDKVIDKFMDIIDNNISMRNAKRLVSTVQCNWSDLLDSEGELLIDLLDYLLLNYLGIVNSKLYDCLSKNRVETGYMENNNPEKLLQVSGDIFTINMNKDNLGREKLSDDEYKKEKLAKVIGEKDLSFVYNIFKELFNVERRGIARISYINSYFMYFERSVDKKLIYKKDFNDAFNSGSKVFIGKLVEWNNNYDIHSLDRLISNMKLDSEKEWIRTFNDMLSISPLRYYDWISDTFFHSKQAIFPKLGADLLEEENGDLHDKKRLYSESLIKFLFDGDVLDRDSLEVIQKKFAFILMSKNLLYTAQNILENKDLSLKEIFKIYWSRYIKLGVDYSNFDRDFWDILDDINFDDKSEIIEILKLNILEHIDEFMNNYTIERLRKNGIKIIFSEYVVISGNNVTKRGKWLLNFINFLESVENKSEKLLNYINDVRNYAKNV